MFGPFGNERQDYNTAMIVCAIRELTDRLIFYNGGQPGEPVSVEDCLLNFIERKEKTAEDLITEGRQQLESLISKFKK
ncbi:hypothetical protein FACS18942_08100 [Planctomycetales bacterium]|nr:hypothetical protein FACS18942_08100 [Planctomycetales bacterium]GHT38272.1 hypothetical protein FACS189427_12250 [Planctomycetales bacterium]